VLLPREGRQKIVYTDINFKTKKALKDSFKEGKKITTYQPGGFFPSVKDGRVSLEGPHFPAPHTWYADVEIKNGVIVKIYG
jgi:hypothetical protein